MFLLGDGAGKGKIIFQKVLKISMAIGK